MFRYEIYDSIIIEIYCIHALDLLYNYFLLTVVYYSIS
jgi:hypothetical protein